MEIATPKRTESMNFVNFAFDNVDRSPRPPKLMKSTYNRCDVKQLTFPCFAIVFK